MGEAVKIYVNRMDNFGSWDDYTSQDLGDSNGGSYPFEEGVVICGNDRMIGMTDASWYKKAMELMEYDSEEMKAYCEEHGLSNIQTRLLVEISEKMFFVKAEQAARIANVLFQDEHFECHCIRGSSQSDWNYCIIRNRCLDKEELEQYYFGEVTQVYTSSDDYPCGAWITMSEMFEAERNGNLTALCKERLDIPDEEEVKLFVSNGMIQTIDWKEIEETEEEIER